MYEPIKERVQQNGNSFYIGKFWGKMEERLSQVNTSKDTQEYT